MAPEETQSKPGARVAYQLLGTCSQKIWGRDVAVLLAELLRRQGIEPYPSSGETSAREDYIAIFRVDYFFDRSAVKLLLASPGNAIVECRDSGRARKYGGADPGTVQRTRHTCPVHDCLVNQRG